MKRIILAAFVALVTISVNAQQVTTLYFLENAPMRHTINPAFQPVSKGFINFSPIGWQSNSLGNNSLTLSDVLFVDTTSGKTITPLHPNADRSKFLNEIRSMMFFNEDMTLGLLNMGFRVKEKGFLTIGLNMRVETGVTIPKSLYEFTLGGGMTDLTGGVNTLGLSGLGTRATVYSELGVGYSYQINDRFTIGGKLKLLMGHAYAGLNAKHLNINASTDEWNMYGNMGLDIAAPINSPYLVQYMNGKTAKEVYDGFTDGSFNTDSLIDTYDIPTLVRSLVMPAGFGAAVDLGFVWKPMEHLQISAALTDLGAIYWAKGMSFNCALDSTKVKFRGAGNVDYSDPAYQDENGHFSTAILMDTVKARLVETLDGITVEKGNSSFVRMTSARLNVGLDLNFWENRIGLGIVSATRLYNSRLYEEVTVGAAFRPFNWLNLAVSYSLMNNGKYSNVGAGISIMPYDGINLTLGMDYIPTSYAGLEKGGKKMYVIPDKARMFNVALGFSVCWGTNKRVKDQAQNGGEWKQLETRPEGQNAQM